MSAPVLLLAGVAMIGWWVVVPIVLAILRTLGVYIVIGERQALVVTTRFWRG